MNRLPTNTIIGLVFLALGTFALILGLWFLGFFKVIFGPHRLDIPKTQDEDHS